MIEMKDNIRSVLESLETLPTDIRDIYRLMLERVVEESHGTTDQGLRIVETILCAVRRLSLAELQCALAIRDGDKEFQAEGCPSREKILGRTGGLITIDDNKIVLFMHHTVDQFLGEEDVFAGYFPNGHVNMKNKCLTYVSFEHFREPAHDIDMLKRQHPFLEYAAYRLGHHMSICFERGEMELCHATKFITDSERMPKAALQVIAEKILTIPSADRIPELIKRCSYLHLAILWDIKPVVTDLIAKKNGLNLRGFKDQTPLQYAARTNFVQAAELLLKDIDNAHINSTEVEGRTALDLILTRPWRDATLKMNNTIFRKVLTNEFDRLVKEAKSKDITDKTPQEYAIDEIRKRRPRQTPDSKPKDLVEELRRLERSEEDEVVMSALIIHCLYMDIANAGEEIAIMLIGKGVDVNSLQVKDTTPLQLAALFGRKKLVQTLLEHGANPFLKACMGFTAMQIATIRAKQFPDKPVFLEIVQVLADRMKQIELEEVQIEDDAEKRSKVMPISA
jgi:hypothetical protein